jgi:methylmalonyl-CoA mutase
MVLAGEASRARISTVPVAEAGGSGVLELAWALSCGVVWMRALLEAGASVSEASRCVRLDLALGTELFSEVARVRAARLLWARLTEACGEACGLFVHAVQGRRALTRRDVWGNLLRGVTAATAGVLGGAQAVSLWPMDARAGVPGSLSRRLAVTTQLLLRDESHLNAVLDPLGGSWAVERLTHDTAERAWALFQEIESLGGADAVLDSGWLRAKVDEDHAVRDQRVRTRRDTVVGVSDFAVAGETRPDTREVDLPALRAALSLPPHVPSASNQNPPLPFRPTAAPFESLRDRSEALANGGTPPRVHLCALGPLKERAARTTWVENALMAGGLGVETVTPDATLSGGVVVLCGSDARYAGLRALLPLLRAEGCTLVLAGRPSALPEGTSVDHHLFAGADLVSVLDAIQTALAGGAA